MLSRLGILGKSKIGNMIDTLATLTKVPLDKREEGTFNCGTNGNFSNSKDGGNRRVARQRVWGQCGVKGRTGFRVSRHWGL